MKAQVDHPAFNFAIFALLLSLPWEFGQMWLYAGPSGMLHLLGIQICMAATAGAAVIMVAALATNAAFAGSQDWVRAPKPSRAAGFVLIGLAVTIAIDIIATRADGILGQRYAPAMQVTPFLGVGLAPLLVWLVVPVLVVWFVRRQIGTASIPLESRARKRLT